MGDIEKYKEYVDGRIGHLSFSFEELQKEINSDEYKKLDIDQGVLEAYKKALDDMCRMLDLLKLDEPLPDMDAVKKNFVDAANNLDNYIDEEILSGKSGLKEEYLRLSYEELADKKTVVLFDSQDKSKSETFINYIMVSDLPKTINAENNDLSNLDLVTFQCFDKTDIDLSMKTLFDEDYVGDSAHIHPLLDKDRIDAELSFQDEDMEKDKNKFKLLFSECGEECTKLLEDRENYENELKYSTIDLFSNQLKAQLKENDAKIKQIIDSQDEEKKAELNKLRKRIIQRSVIKELLSKPDVATKLGEVYEAYETAKKDGLSLFNKDMNDINVVMQYKQFKENISLLSEKTMNLNKDFEKLKYDIGEYKYFKKNEIQPGTDVAEFMKVYDNAKKSIHLEEADVANNCKNAGINNLNKALVMINKFKGKSFSEQYKEVIKSVARLTFDYNKEGVDKAQIFADYKRVNDAIDGYLNYATFKSTKDGSLLTRNVGTFSNQSSRDSKVNILQSLKSYLANDFVKDCAEKNIDLRSEKQRFNEIHSKVTGEPLATGR